MLIPRKHENIRNNILVLGSEIITILQKRPRDVETLFRLTSDRVSMNLDQFYNTLVFLWLTDLVELDSGRIFIRHT